MEKTKISVIMPTFRAAATIRDSIESVLAQTEENWELIIVDDAGGDETGEIAEAFADSDNRIRVLTNPENKGIAASRNAAIAEARGEFLAFLDSDDFWREDKLEKQTHLMERENAVISYTATSYVNVAGQASKYTLAAAERLTHKQLLRRNLMSCSSVMVRRDAMIPFPPGYMHEDYAVWLEIVKKTGAAHGLNEPLLVYRMSADSKSAKRAASAKMIYNAYRYAGYSRIVSGFFTLRYALHSISKRRQIRLGFLAV